MSRLLRVEHAGRPWFVDTDDVLTFGRSRHASVRLDVAERDPFLHRLVGGFSYVGAQWTVTNLGDKAKLVVEVEGGIQATVRPGSHGLPLPHGAHGSVGVRTTPTRAYEVAFWTPSQTFDTAMMADPTGTTTEEVVDALDLTDTERELLVAFCRARLADRLAPLPTIAGLVATLGITKKEYESRLNNIARKLNAVAPLDGLVGTNAGRASQRADIIVGWAIEQEWVQERDVRWLGRRLAARNRPDI